MTPSCWIHAGILGQVPSAIVVRVIVMSKPDGASHLHPSQKVPLQTPPQAGWGHPSKRDIAVFFDPSAYKNMNASLVKPPPRPVFERRTTKENIAVFFDPATHRQKRSAPSDASSAPTPSVRAKTMSQDELIEKFKLAAKLNGIDWESLAVSRLPADTWLFLFFWVHIHVHLLHLN